MAINMKNVFLYGKVDQEFYNQWIFRVKTILHMCVGPKRLSNGLKQALRAWYGKITNFLTYSGYSVAYVYTFFFKANGRKLVVVPMYMDDLIIT